VLKDVELLSGTPRAVKVTLEVGALTQSVEVVGGSQLVQTQGHGDQLDGAYRSDLDTADDQPERPEHRHLPARRRYGRFEPFAAVVHDQRPAAERDFDHGRRRERSGQSTRDRPTAFSSTSIRSSI
jgi:hypothetical protein